MQTNDDDSDIPVDLDDLSEDEVAQLQDQLDLDDGDGDELSEEAEELLEYLDKAQTVKAIHHVRGFLKFQNPAYMRSIIEDAKAEAKEDARGGMDTMKAAVIVVMLMIGGAIAWYMLQTGAPQQAAASASRTGATISLLALTRAKPVTKLRTLWR